MLHKSLFNSLGWLNNLRQSKHISAIFALSLSLTLAACGGGNNSVTDNVSAEPGPDGVAPTLTSVTIYNSKDLGPEVKLGQTVAVEFVADEALMTPVVTIAGQAASVSGSVRSWKATRVMNETDVDGDVPFVISFSDPSGEVGTDVTGTTDGSVMEYCAAGCVKDTGDSPIVGTWKLAPVAGAIGVGPSAGSIEWWSNSQAEADSVRACLFDDTYTFTADGSFSQDMGTETWIETWQGAAAEGCGTPVAPHDGSATGSTYTYSEDSLTIVGYGAHVGLAKAVNAGELSSGTVVVPNDVTYSVTMMAADGQSMTLSIETGTGVYWQFKFVKMQQSPIVGTWKLAPVAAAVAVGPFAGSADWWSNSQAEADSVRACLFDDTYTFGADGSFSQDMGAETWLETWQGAAAEGCGTPVAPHDGSAVGSTYTYDDDSLTITGLGAHVGLAKAVNAGELSAGNIAVPAAITYSVDLMAADGLSMTLSIETGSGVFWTFKFVKQVEVVSQIVGTWKLAPVAGALGVGPAAGSTEWWSNSQAEADSVRACLFDDTYTFAADGSFSQDMGTETWIETWQGAAAEGCGAPVAPHDGSATGATYAYDEDSLTINGLGAHVGLAKAVNAGELSAGTVAVPNSITYSVSLMSVDGLSMTLSIETGTGVFWQFKFVKVVEGEVAPIVGTWKLAPVAAALGVGPAAGSVDWWSNSQADADSVRACLFDDTYTFAADGSFSQDMGTETWIETWQGATAESCGAPVAPHDGSATDATYTYDEDTLTINGLGAHVGLAKAVNAGELSSGSIAVPDSVSYSVTMMSVDGQSMTLSIETGSAVFWQFKFVKVN